MALKTIDELNVPEVLYKYQSWGTKWGKLSISNREAFFASALDFEDKLDCKNPIRYDLLSEGEWFDFFIYESKIRNKYHSEKQHLENAKYQLINSPRKDSSYTQKIMDLSISEYYSREGILCLTKDCNNEEMWDKYANHRKGFCIAYNTKEVLKILDNGSCNDVNYVNKLPTILPIPFMNLYEIINKRVYHKLSKWSFENEFRIFQLWEDGATIEKRKMKLPKSAFNRIILGENMTKLDIIDITESIEKNIGDISIIEKKPS